MSKGQTILEHIILIGIVTVVVFYMGPAIKRGLQSLIKITSDQIANQQDADQLVTRPLAHQPADERDTVTQDDSQGGYLVQASTKSSTSSTTEKFETGNFDAGSNGYVHITNTVIDEGSETSSASVTDAGFTKEH